LNYQELPNESCFFNAFQGLFPFEIEKTPKKFPSTLANPEKFIIFNKFIIFSPDGGKSAPFYVPKYKDLRLNFLSIGNDVL